MKRRTRKKHSLRHLLLGLFLCCISGAAFFGIKVCGLDAWHEFDPGKILSADESLIIYDSDKNEICTLSKEQMRITIPLSDVPTAVQKAFISAEDARFYEHEGIDIIRVGGAIIKDIESGGYVQGASTITQQLIKLSHLSSEKTLQRKADEAILAFIMEKAYTKDEILEMYLNYVYFGGGFYGIEAASRGYFGISAKELSVSQGAMLAGILKSPSAYAPHLHYEASLGRRNTVLSLMREYGYITDAQCEEAKREEIVIAPKSRGERSTYTDYAMKEACSLLNITVDELLRGGYRIYTAQDTQIQSVCDEIYADDAFFPTGDVQSALALTDTETGEICAMEGGRGDYVQAGYNRASDMRRQPGSCIKPVMVYAPAIEYYGYTAATVISDEPRSFGSYTPKNSGNKYYGSVTLRKAVKSSLNIPAVTVLDDIGIESGKAFCERIGIEFDEKDNSLSLALGGFTYGVSPLQLANAYGAVCDGFYTPATAIRMITDRHGSVLYSHRSQKTRVLSDENAFILTDILCSVTEEGTGHRLGGLDFDVASKTGTVAIDDDYNRDAWIAAYTQKHSVAVWIGYDSQKDGKMPSSVTGGSYPAEIVKALFSRMYETEKPYFEKPDGVVEVMLDAEATDADSVPVLAGLSTPKEYSVAEYFAKGTEPREYSTYRNIPLPPDDFLCTGCGRDFAIFTFTVRERNVFYELIRTDGTKETVLDEYRGECGQVVICTDGNAPHASVQYFIRPHKLIEGERLSGADSARVTVSYE